MVRPNARFTVGLAYVCFVGVVWALGSPACVAVAQDDVPFRFSLDKPSISLREPVFIKLEVENPLAEAISFDLGIHAKARFRLSIAEPAGTMVSPPALEEVGFGRSGNVTVGAGETFHEEILVNEWYQFPEPGTYQVRLKISDLALKTESGALLSNQVVSPPMILQVGPRDPMRLTKLCERLTEQARTSRSYPIRGQSAHTLSYVVDPVAVPYLAKLAGTPLLRRAAVHGLARIAQAEGLESVIAQLRGDARELEPEIEAELAKHKPRGR
jgi:hypothetical protein